MLPVFALVLLLLPAGVEGFPAWWGSSQWFDWSDFRFTMGGRAFVAHLASSTATINNVEADLREGSFNVLSDPEPFRELWVIFYFDRLGFRGHFEEHKFRGRPGLDLDYWEFRPNTSRVGADLDIIRYPFLRLGVNFDVNVTSIELTRTTPPPPPTDVNIAGVNTWQSTFPITIGLHGRAFPLRIREVPVMIQGRIRVPLPYLDRPDEARITDWEVSAGLRPAIWETSLLGYSTFSFSVEAGYRSLSLDAHLDTTATDVAFQHIDVKARWQGPFAQIAVFF